VIDFSRSIWEAFSPWLQIVMFGCFPFLAASIVLRKALFAGKIIRSFWIAGFVLLLAFPTTLFISGGKYQIRVKAGFPVMANRFNEDISPESLIQWNDQIVDLRRLLLQRFSPISSTELYRPGDSTFQELKQGLKAIFLFSLGTSLAGSLLSLVFPASPSRIAATTSSETVSTPSFSLVKSAIPHDGDSANPDGKGKIPGNQAGTLKRFAFFLTGFLGAGAFLAAFWVITEDHCPSAWHLYRIVPRQSPFCWYCELVHPLLGFVSFLIALWVGKKAKDTA
jgi:hypothetical protein